jgi:hypothetical protein
LSLSKRPSDDGCYEKTKDHGKVVSRRETLWPDEPWLQKGKSWSAGDLAREGLVECPGACSGDLYFPVETELNAKYIRFFNR